MSQKNLFTPGPLNTSMSVKQAMLIDMGSRDVEFIDAIAAIRHDLLDIVHVDDTIHTAVLLQGPGSFAVESVFANYIGKANNVKVWGFLLRYKQLR